MKNSKNPLHQKTFTHHILMAAKVLSPKEKKNQQ